MPLSARPCGAPGPAGVEAFGQWSLNWEPGSSYEYHPTSAHWVLAEIIDRVTGGDFRDVVQDRVTDPAGLPRLLGLEPGPAQEGIADRRLGRRAGHRRGDQGRLRRGLAARHRGHPRGAAGLQRP